MSDDDPDVPTDGEAGDEGGECFVIAPIDDPRTDVRRRTDGLLDEAIRPVVEEKIGLDVTAAHELPKAGSITRQVIQRLLEAELVIADLTSLNANVMYELAVRHAKGRPVVLIADDETSLPFDITTERTIFYEESFHGLNELKPKLESAARAALEDEEPDNPIYRAQQDFQMREAVAGDDKMEYILNRLDDIETGLQNRPSPHRSTRGGAAMTGEAPPGLHTVLRFSVSGSENEIDRFEEIVPTCLESISFQSSILKDPTIFDWTLNRKGEGEAILKITTSAHSDSRKNGIASAVHKAAQQSDLHVEEEEELIGIATNP